MTEMVSNQSILSCITSEASRIKSFSRDSRRTFTTDQDSHPDDRWTNLAKSAVLHAGHLSGRINEGCTRRAFTPAESDPSKQSLPEPNRLLPHDMPANPHCRLAVQSVAMSVRSVFLTALDTNDWITD
jgi:hypothetical protein